MPFLKWYNHISVYLLYFQSNPLFKNFFHINVKYFLKKIIQRSYKYLYYHVQTKNLG